MELKELKLVFKTKNKQNIIEVFNYRCPNHKIKESDLQGDQEIYLPINLTNWQDIDDGSDFTNVLTALEKLTNPKSGNPVLILDVELTGYDETLKQHFIYKGDYIRGKHSVVGHNEDGTLRS